MAWNTPRCDYCNRHGEGRMMTPSGKRRCGRIDCIIASQQETRALSEKKT